MGGGQSFNVVTRAGLDCRTLRSVLPPRSR